ncbi:MAG: hypothetical protein ACK46A_08195 [Akkermansiaceae bacterium]|jgi:hypothetical protein|nr:hypothetical protein [Luteolibacter sp.]
MKALKVLVLLVSISAASVLVWYAARNKKPAERDGRDAISAAEMQGSSKSKIIGQVFLNVESEDTLDANILAPSSKSAGIIGPDDISEIVESDEGEFKVTEEEVSRMRDMMMSTSKSGRIMSDEKIREMLEDQKKEEFKHEKSRKLMPSSKSIDAILKPEDVKEIIEGDEPKNLPELNLIPSSKNPNRLLEPKDVEKIIERGVSDFVKPVEPEK